MVTLEKLAAWLCTSMGLALVGFGILAVPANAFADYTDQCHYCQTKDDPTACASTCCPVCMGCNLGQCCNDACNGDPECIYTCCNGNSTCEQDAGVSFDTSCPSPTANPCGLGDGFPSTCGMLTCESGKKTCQCVYGAFKCTCPP